MFIILLFVIINSELRNPAMARLMQFYSITAFSHLHNCTAQNQRKNMYDSGSIS